MRRRQGFTLVELLVAMALIMFIMAILSQAFVTAMGTFRNLKASGDMAEKLRATTQQLQRDLAADHFEGKKRLSNPNFWVNGPPEQGYFVSWQNPNANPDNTVTVPLGGILQENTPTTTDLDGVASFRNTGARLAFTIKTRGNQMGDFLSGGAPPAFLASSASFGPTEARYQGTAYNYQWAEVAWFLVPQPDVTVTDPTTGSAPVTLWTLIRRQHLAVPDNSLIVPPIAYAPNAASCLELSAWNNGGNLYFNSPSDLTVPGRRFGGGNPAAFTTISQDLAALGQANPTLSGADIVLTDVVSFDVRVLPMYPAGTAPANAVDPTESLTSLSASFNNGNPNYAGMAVFDTWSSLKDSLSDYSDWNGNGAGTSIPMWNAGSLSYAPGYPNPPSFAGNTTNPITLTGSGPIIQAIQISIRIWDSKTNQTRQVTMVQAM